MFAGWDKTVSPTAVENATYTALFDDTYIKYTITFVDYDNTVLSTKQYHYGDKVDEPVTPNRPSDANYRYTFAGWNSVITSCQGDKTYKATYSAHSLGQDQNTVVIYWNVGGQMFVTVCEYGTLPVFVGSTDKASSNQYDYTFAGWDKTVELATTTAVYTAVYTQTAREYVITFVDYDNTVISTQKYHYGDIIVAPEAPSREKSKGVKYTFAGWDKPVTTVTTDATYIAEYQAIQKSVTWQTWVIALGAAVVFFIIGRTSSDW